MLRVRMETATLLICSFFWLLRAISRRLVLRDSTPSLRNVLCLQYGVELRAWLEALCSKAVNRNLFTTLFSRLSAHEYFNYELYKIVAVSGCLGLNCKEHQYAFGTKCCTECAPGERMRTRCTAFADTVCGPCQDEYFSSEHSHSFCKSCTICNTRKGSMEVKKCEKTSDRICMCLPGYMPDSRYTLGSVCSPCPEGWYSIGQNENCQRWTNCSILGKSTLRQGTKTNDAVCSNHVTQPAASQSATPALNLSTTDSRNNVSTAVLSPSRPSVIPFICPDTNSPTETNWGSLSLILICLILLMVSGMSILLLIIQAAKKETKKRPCRNNQQEGRSFRIPIQEEQIDSNSSLIKN